MDFGLKPSGVQSNSECHNSKFGSQAVGDKLHSLKGNNPDHRLRSLSAS
jgi:hypothetical protein